MEALFRNPVKLGHELGYSHLTAVHDDWIKSCWWPTERESNFVAFRGSYKTTSRVVVGTIYNLIFNPNETILLCRKTDDGAAATLSEIADHFERPFLRWLYREFFNIKTPLVHRRNNAFTLATKTKVTKERSVESVGIGGSVVGRHYDVILADDIVTDRDRYSEVERTRTINFARELRNVINPGGKIRWQGTYWHKADANTILPKPRANEFFPIGTVNVYGLDDDLQKKIREETPMALYAANYLLELIEDVSPEFSEPLKGECTAVLQKRAYIDPAFGGNDFTVLTIGGMNDGKFYVTRGVMWRQNIAELYQTIENILRLENIGMTVIESNGAQSLAAYEFQRRGLSVKTKRNTQNKYARITSALKKNWQRIYFGPNVQPGYMAQVLEYSENATHDDAPDSLAGFIESYNGQAGSISLRMY